MKEARAVKPKTDADKRFEARLKEILWAASRDKNLGKMFTKK